MAPVAIREKISPGATSGFTCIMNTSVNTAIGDLLVLWHFYDYHAVTDMITPAGGGVWELRGIADTGINKMHLKLWTRPVTTNGVQTIICINAKADAFHMPVLYVLKPVNSGTYLSVDAVATSTGFTTASHVCPSVFTAGSDDLLLCGVGESPLGSGNYTWQVGMTEETDVNAGAVSQASTASQTLVTSGATGTRTATFIAARDYVSATIAIRADCDSSAAAYYVEVDWNDDGDYTDTYDNVSSELLMNTPITTGYGRDDARALSPISAGVMNFELCDPDAIFSPDNPASPIVNDVGPGRNTRLRVTHNGNEYVLATGRIDKIDSVSSKYNQHVPVTVFDGLASLTGTTISTALYQGIKTGAAITNILDAIGWPIGLRRIDTGSTSIPWWWEEQRSAFEAVARVVYSEGPPALAYIDQGTGEFVFEDRQHRTLRPESNNVQATLCVDLSTCISASGPCPTGSIGFTDPFTYDSGLKDIVNVATIPIIERQVAPLHTVIWQNTGSFKLNNSSTVLNIVAEGSDPFIEASVTVDAVGTGTVSASLSRTSGQSTAVFLSTVGQITVNSVVVTARLVPIARTYQVEQTNPTSIVKHGRRTYPNNIPWVGPNDAATLADIIISRYAFQQPTVRVRVVNCDSFTLERMLALTLGDMVRIINARYKLDDTFIIERIERDIIGRGRIHAVTFSCERAFTQFDNAFTFNVVNRGFDDGVFGRNAVQDAGNVFIFGEAGQGFNDGEFAY